MGYIITLGMILLVSCEEDDKYIQPNEPDDSPYEQYGTPFNNVPDASDVVMYEVNLRAFSPDGDLDGVTNRIDAIAALGVNVIWLMPIHPIGEEKSVNSPYSVRDYKAVNPEFGTLQDLRQLTDAAHAMEMAVILDWVSNHTAWDNAWIENETWYTQDGSGNIIHPPGTNWLDVADLNYDNINMRDSMLDAMQYWVYEANVDGFRCDYADGVPFDFWKNAWSTLESDKNRKFIFFAEGTRQDHFNAGFDLNFGWQFYGAIKDVFKGQNPNRLFSAHMSEYSSTLSGKHWIRFTTNHDESAWDATPVSLFNGIKGALAASVATVFIGGVPLIYGSQEVGTASNVPFFSNSTIDWSANPDMITAYEKMLQFYVTSTVSRYGQNVSYPDEDVMCLIKEVGGDELLIMVNVRNQAVSFQVPTELENSEWYDVINDTSFSLGTTLSMEPYQYYILD